MIKGIYSPERAQGPLIYKKGYRACSVLIPFLVKVYPLRYAMPIFFFIFFILLISIPILVWEVCFAPLYSLPVRALVFFLIYVVVKVYPLQSFMVMFVILFFD